GPGGWCRGGNVEGVSDGLALRLPRAAWRTEPSTSAVCQARRPQPDQPASTVSGTGDHVGAGARAADWLMAEPRLRRRQWEGRGDVVRYRDGPALWSPWSARRVVVGSTRQSKPSMSVISNANRLATETTDRR